MTTEHWYTGGALTPGRELVRTDRTVYLCEQVAGHAQLLLRSDGPTRLDLLFKGVIEQRLHATYEGLVVRCAAEPGWFDLESGDIRDAVRATAFGWDEQERTHFGPDTLAARIMPLPFGARFNPREPDFGAHQPSGPVIPLPELVEALRAGERPDAGPVHRYLHAVVVAVTRTLPDGSEHRRVAPIGLYLTRGEAEAAIDRDLTDEAALREFAALPVAAVEDVTRAMDALDRVLERWIVAVPLQL